jgi:hypothetical protein
MEKIPYTTETEREQVLNEKTALGLVLKEDLSALEKVEEKKKYLVFMTEAEAQDVNVAEAIRQLKETDTGMARVTEDIVALLISRDVIALTDLPAEAQDKLKAREDLRAILSG